MTTEVPVSDLERIDLAAIRARCERVDITSKCVTWQLQPDLIVLRSLRCHQCQCLIWPPLSSSWSMLWKWRWDSFPDSRKFPRTYGVRPSKFLSLLCLNVFVDIQSLQIYIPPCSSRRMYSWYLASYLHRQCRQECVLLTLSYRTCYSLWSRDRKRNSGHTLLSCYPTHLVAR